MFTIVVSHYTVFSAANPDEMDLGFNKFILDSFGIGKLGVAIFVMITGYFMIDSKFKIERVINIVLQTLFYSIAFFSVFSVADKSFSIIGLINSVFPIIRQQYWFITAYVILSLFIPFINKAINSISRKQFIVLLAVLIFYFSIAPTFLDFDAYGYGGHIGYMVLFYCVGAYLKINPHNFFNNKTKSLILGIVFFVLMIVSAVVIDVLGTKFSEFNGKSGKFLTVYSVLVLFTALCFVSYFMCLKPHYSKIVNKIGGCTLGVYLIHENNYVRTWLWGTMLNNSSYSNSNLLFLHFLFSVIFVFICCTGIEYIRKYILEKYIFKGTINKANSIANYVVLNIKNLTDSVIQNN